MKSVLSAFILIAVTLLTGCAWSTPPSVGPSPLAVASCPRLSPLADDTFAATTEKLVQVAGQYRQCRAAAGVLG